ncbi:phosphoglycerate mutase family protein [Janibacter terrae]|uniref:Phosphoglycerate mutase family protein n=1 Tax=Janibacter terrae TaxID=103817 RepID=A0ABZ2FDL9_9MICO|nr:histidine phosphatase family protein [Janibacter terrae]MBA4083587.1 histidine phosphatase family protein [Kytococcus sp.]HCE60466.1 histidine phosphatase family protein [Janibacter terrae]
MSPTRVHLVRHGESTWNRDGLVQGAHRGPGQSVLTDAGRADAARAGLALGAVLGPPRSERALALWSSDLMRALQTAEIISVALRPAGWHASVRNEAGLREQALGRLEGERSDLLRAEEVPQDRHISEVRWGGGESMQDVFERVGEWFAPALIEQPEHLVVVSHEHTIRAALAWLRSHSHRDIDWDEPIDPGSVTSVDVVD